MDGNNTTPPTAFEMKGAAETLATMVEQASKTGRALMLGPLRGFADQLMAWSKAMEKREGVRLPSSVSEYAARIFSECAANPVFRPCHRAIKLEDWINKSIIDQALLRVGGAAPPPPKEPPPQGKPEDFVTFRPLRPHEMPNDEDAIVLVGGKSTYMRKVG